MQNYTLSSLTQEKTQILMRGIYTLLEKQAQSYYKARHFGESSGIPVELAQELTESMEYSLCLVGNLEHYQNVEDALHAGQQVLKEKCKQAQHRLQLVIATCPSWQTDSRWDSIQCLTRFLNSYDYLHLAHHIRDDFYYPIWISVPDSLKGIDWALFYLNILWWENQIMDGVPEQIADEFWSVLSSDTYGEILNPCEQFLINAIGKSVLHDNLNTLIFTPAERDKLCRIFKMDSPTQRKERLTQALQSACKCLHIIDANALAYASAIVPQIAIRLESAISHENLAEIFL